MKVHGTDIKQTVLSAPVASRSAKLFYYLQQSLQKFDRGMELVRSTSMRQRQAACGYECMRQLRNIFSVVARMEAIAVRDEALKLSGKASGSKSGSNPGGTHVRNPASESRFGTQVRNPSST